MADKSSTPDYELDDTMELTSVAQVRAIGHQLRTTILPMSSSSWREQSKPDELVERLATTGWSSSSVAYLNRVRRRTARPRR